MHMHAAHACNSRSACSGRMARNVPLLVSTHRRILHPSLHLQLRRRGHALVAPAKVLERRRARKVERPEDVPGRRRARLHLHVAVAFAVAVAGRLHVIVITAVVLALRAALCHLQRRRRADGDHVARGAVEPHRFCRGGAVSRVPTSAAWIARGPNRAAHPHQQQKQQRGQRRRHRRRGVTSPRHRVGARQRRRRGSSPRRRRAA
eukprot:350841-Chlamydomonas_euryale.AAC.7